MYVLLFVFRRMFNFLVQYEWANNRKSKYLHVNKWPTLIAVEYTWKSRKHLENDIT